MKQLWLFFVLFSISGFAQIEQKGMVNRTIIPKKDTINLEKISITPFHFSVTDSLHNKIDSTKYKIDFVSAKLILKDTTLLNKKLILTYKKYPNFLTKTYRALDTNLIVKDLKNNFKLYHSKITDKKNVTPFFNGLKTKGNITRGIRFGNNQDGVLDSNLKLQIQGKLSDKVSIKANIQDSNIPIQNNGYTQRLDEYDRIFLTLFTKKWQVIAGDLPFNKNTLKYLHFQKRVQGISVNSTLGDSTKNKNFYVSGAVVRGKFTSIRFNGQNGNQGPYNIINQENAYWLLVANSEKVYVNGKKMERGKEKDYVIDYNTAEIYFNPTFPINATMRIYVEFQISDQNYTRFASFNEFHSKTKNAFIQFSLYNENDAKNSGINQNLTQEQIEILANAGDNDTQMTVPSAVLESYDPDKIQYKKEVQNGMEIFVFSTNPNDELYHVNFTYVGKNNGNYKIDNILANGKVFTYIAPINNEKQGSYAPVISLKAPNKLQLANLKTDIKMDAKTEIASELQYSFFDKNTFSNLQDNDNNGFAGNIKINRIILNKKWQLDTEIYNEFISDNFKTIERIQNIEFAREWNIPNNIKSQQNQFYAGIHLKKDSLLHFTYTLNNLELKSNFKGNKHQFLLKSNRKNWQFNSATSLLKTNSNLENTFFVTTNNSVKYSLKNKWIGTSYILENNQRKSSITNELANNSFQNEFVKSFIGFGNKQKIFTEIGYFYRKTDSVQNIEFATIEKANSWYVDATFIQNKKTNLSVYTNYEINDSRVYNQTKFLNTQIKYRQQFFNEIVQFNSNYQTGSGNLPQQDYQFIEVEPGHGYYQWIDYNNDNIKDLDEFEVAPFQDQANYLKIALPTIKYIKVNTNKLQAGLNIQFSKFAKKKKWTKFLSHFTNNSSISTDVKRTRNSEFIHVNPFDYNNNSSVLSLKSVFKNNLYFNRGKQHFFTTISYLEASNKSLFITGFQEINLHQKSISVKHLFYKQWLLAVTGILAKNESFFETFPQRNFAITRSEEQFNLDFLQSKQLKFGLAFTSKKMKNSIGGNEKLQANTYGAKINFVNNDKASFQASFNYISNVFEGNSLSAVGFKMLEGLQDGKNITLQLLAQKKINSFLFLNLSYQARNSATTKTIHIGNVQLRAVF